VKLGSGDAARYVLLRKSKDRLKIVRTSRTALTVLVLAASDMPTIKDRRNWRFFRRRIEVRCGVLRRSYRAER